MAAPAGGQHHDVGIQCAHIVRIGGLSQPAVDAQALDFKVEPADDARHLLALRRGGQQDLPAQRGVAFQQHHVMAALG